MLQANPKDQGEMDVKDCCASLKIQLTQAQDERHEAARIGNLLLTELSSIKAKAAKSQQDLKLHDAGLFIYF
jgi:hypothetical protein